MIEKLMLNKIKHYFNQIKHIFHWIPILWKDQDWDHGFFYDIVIFKLQNMFEYFLKRSIVVKEDRTKIVFDIFNCIEILKYLKDEKYEEDGYKLYYDKYPIPENWMNDGEWIERNGQKLFRLNDHSTPESRELFKKCTDISEELYKEKFEELFLLLRDNVRGWWD